MQVLTYQEQLELKIREHTKLANRYGNTEIGIDNRLAAMYYGQNLGGSACASYEVFIKSWAGGLWKERNLGKAEKIQKENNWRRVI